MSVDPNPNQLPTEASRSAAELTHVDENGHAHMVDISEKSVTVRVARATSQIRMSFAAADSIRKNTVKKGDVISVARIAAIQAVKHTSTLIPLCHALLIENVQVECSWHDEVVLEWCVTVKSSGKTGVEMEALTAASVAALTVYDMCKAIDRSMQITNISLLEKSGGVRGDYLRKE